MKKTYEAPEFAFLLLAFEDILTTSTGDVNDDLNYPAGEDPYQ